MLLDLTRYSPAVLLKEGKELAVLAWPILLAQVAAVGVGFVDTVMAGNVGTDDLSAVALGSAAFTTVLISLMGIMTALNPVIAQLHGAGETGRVGEAGRQGLWFGLLSGLAGMLLLGISVRPFLNYLEWSEKVEAMLSQYLYFTAPAMPAAMIHRAIHAYLASLGRPKPIMWVSWAALLLNIPLNYIFVYGKFGLPALGGAGCGLATLLVFWFSAAALWHFAAKDNGLQKFGLCCGFSRPDIQAIRQYWHLGWPAGLSYFLEVSLFTFIMFLITRFGQTDVAAQQIVISLTGIIYMIPQSVGAAVTVRVGFSLGKGWRCRARYISGVGFLIGILLALATMILLAFFRQLLADIYTDDAEVLALASSVLLFAAVFQLFDFTQCIASYALRGYKITKAPMLVHGIAFWGLGLLPGYLLANHGGLKIYGFWTALTVSLAAAAILLVWLLERHSRILALEHGFPNAKEN